MRQILTRQILENVFGKNIISSDSDNNWDSAEACWKTTISNCFEIIWNYATTGASPTWREKGLTPPSGIDASEKIIVNPGWIDKHLCPYYLWSSSERKKNGKFCKYTCTEESIEHIAIAARDRTYDGSSCAGIREDIYVLLIGEMFSSVSMMKVNYVGHV